VFILLGIYLLTSFGTQAFLGPDFVVNNSDDAVYAVGKQALGGGFNKLLIIAILTSAAASCQTTILPATRSMLSMSSHGAAPRRLSSIDPRRLTPAFSTWFFGAVSVAWYVMLVMVTENTDTDAYGASIAAVGLAIAFYYGLSGYACVWYYRRYLTRSVKNFLLMGLLPLFGAVMLSYIFIKTVIDANAPDYAPGTLFGIGTVLFIGTVLLVLGVPLMLWAKAKYPEFWRIAPDPVETVPDPYSDDGPAAPLGTYRKGD
jgi:amino acid transporter